MAERELCHVPLGTLQETVLGLFRLGLCGRPASSVLVFASHDFLLNDV